MTAERGPAGNPDGGRWTDEGGGGSIEGEGESERPRTPSTARTILAGWFTSDDLNLTVQEFTAKNCLGSIHRRLPREFYGMAIAEVMAERDAGNARAKTCLKLLGRDDYRKPETLLFGLIEDFVRE